MFNGTVVAKINDQKHLGFIFDSSLSFIKHLNEKTIKAKKNIGIIKHLSIFLPHKTLDLMYTVVVPSCLLWYISHIYIYISYTIKTDSSWRGLKCANGKN